MWKQFLLLLKCRHFYDETWGLFNLTTLHIVHRTSGKCDRNWLQLEHHMNEIQEIHVEFCHDNAWENTSVLWDFFCYRIWKTVYLELFGALIPDWGSNRVLLQMATKDGWEHSCYTQISGVVFHWDTTRHVPLGYEIIPRTCHREHIQV